MSCSDEGIAYKMARQYVALDLETTGLDAERDSIIEVGAVRFAEDQVLEEMTTLVNPGCALSPKIQRLTGIQADELRGAPPLRQAMRRLEAFVGSNVVVGHSIGFDLAFLARQGVLTSNRKYDTFELSTILLPHAERHSLQHLADELRISSRTAHRALPDAKAAMRLFLLLREAALTLPLSTLEQIAAIGRRSGWEQGSFFEDVLREQMARPSGRSIAQQLYAKAAGDTSLLAKAYRPGESRTDPRSVRSSLDVEGLAASLEPGGVVARAMAGYEHRPQQVQMARAVAKAMSEGGRLVVEAGTGVGKSLAYLLPAVAFATLNDERVVISTHTINLQEQLYFKDVPAVAAALNAKPRVAVLKGRGNYVCLSRVHALASQATLSPWQGLALAKVIAWLPATTSGDRSELFLNTPQEREVWQEMCNDVAWCRGDRCPERRAGRCFYQRARAEAEQAHLVIVNHALLTADAATEGGTLPEFEHLVIDEAHQLQAACTNNLSLKLSMNDLKATLRLISFSDRNGRGGALPAVQHLLGVRPQSRAGIANTLAELEKEVDEIAAFLGEVSLALFSCAERLVPSGRGRERGFTAQRRIMAQERSAAEWQHLVQTWEPASRHAHHALTLIAEVQRALQNQADSENDADPAQALAVGARRLEEQVTALDEIIAAPLDENVYWIAAQESGEAVQLHRAPRSVARHLSESLFADKRCAVLTSATLSTEGSFNYFAGQVGLEEYDSMLLGSPFEYRQAALVCVATDIPEPRQPGHQHAIEQAILGLARSVGGRLMALFTSYSQLRTTTWALSQPLEEENISLLSQAEGGSRTQLLETFKASERAVLLGTRSFWEGVDVPGDALQCLVMAKLPFLVPDDPLVAARSEQFSDAFNEYLVPEAILAFRQGFGRLIRTKSDRGVFVILDSRLRGKAYGMRFLRALPDCTFYEGPASSLPALAARWLQRGRQGPSEPVITSIAGIGAAGDDSI